MVYRDPTSPIKSTPFLNHEGTPFLEVHRVRHIGDGESDTPENAVTEGRLGLAWQQRTANSDWDEIVTEQDQLDAAARVWSKRR